MVVESRESFKVNVASGTVNVFTPGVFDQWTNVSVASGATNTYGPFDISIREIKTVGVWSNTGDVGVTVFVSNDGTNFKSYYNTTVTSGTSKTASFTEVFRYMRVDVLGITNAGYTLMISRL
jgi:hypothetical protein